MSRTAIRNALETHLNALSPLWPTAWENTVFTEPANGSPWQRAKLLLGDTAPLGMHAGSDEEWSGVLHVTLFGKAGSGPKAVEDRAALLRGDKGRGIVGHFHRGLSLTSDGVTLTILQPVDGPAIDNDPRWYGLPVRIPFFCHV